MVTSMMVKWLSMPRKCLLRVKSANFIAKQGLKCVAKLPTLQKVKYHSTKWIFIVSETFPINLVKTISPNSGFISPPPRGAGL